MLRSLMESHQNEFFGGSWGVSEREREFSIYRLSYHSCICEIPNGNFHRTALGWHAESKNHLAAPKEILSQISMWCGRMVREIRSFFYSWYPIIYFRSLFLFLFLYVRRTWDFKRLWRWRRKCWAKKESHVA